MNRESDLLNASTDWKNKEEYAWLQLIDRNGNIKPKQKNEPEVTYVFKELSALHKPKVRHS